MRVFLTGATGFIGTAVAEELIGAGHSVLGVARTDEGAKALASRGVEPHRGELADHASFIAGAKACDATIHCAFIHDFSRFAENIEIEQRAVAAMLDALEGSGKPFVVSSASRCWPPAGSRPRTTGRCRRGAAPPRTWCATPGAAASAAPSSGWPRSPTRRARAASCRRWSPSRGTRASRPISATARTAGRPGTAAMRPACIWLAVEKGEAGAAYHPMGDDGVTTRDIAEAIGKRLGLPTVSLSPEQAGEHFGWIGMFAGIDIPASSATDPGAAGLATVGGEPDRGHPERARAVRHAAVRMSDPLTLRGQRVVVIGGASGIGCAVAEAALGRGRRGGGRLQRAGQRRGRGGAAGRRRAWRGGRREGRGQHRGLLRARRRPSTTWSSRPATGAAACDGRGPVETSTSRRPTRG